jgi:predicted transcriptional regulator
MESYKLRIKHPSGAEFEAEGPLDFIINEKRGFIEEITGTGRGGAQTARPAEPGQEPGLWQAITAVKAGLLQLRHKSPEIAPEDAFLALAAAYRLLEGRQETGAITLSKAIKASGYAPDRLDRLIARDIKEGLITASGSKRGRTYSITQKGLERAWAAAMKLKKIADSKG